MNIAIIVWNKDPAGMNIKSNLIEHFNFKETDETYDNAKVCKYDDNVTLYTIDEQHIFADDLDKKIDADIFIFATTHRSKAGTHSLSIHTPGNWKNADLGGKEHELCIAMPFLLKDAYNYLKEFNDLTDYEVTLEVTHHGPYIEKPCMFIEIGSTEEQWNNKDAGKIIANAIIHVLTSSSTYKPCILIGGGHYSQVGNKIMERTDYAIGHICPKYTLEFLDKETLHQAIERSSPKAEEILIDWKGLGQEKERIMNLIEKTGLPFERAQRILK